ncbi:hypothetical protein SPBR_07802 [Sporothrix brasiliensis 5110]|uniref:Uncharacterized protein n=1 Tax=Sporothrix brasiliensis 5110 TaxID=1398154 RepID=A0A0C2IP01_9PEZI|nr:uncharacterized protein SPBR_07802 [Sporothrix brasiliensis 5110]KIH88635.1 hypothetical protein SPBR_07802 [Sporothrix brasiliensis 5110]
MQPRAASRSSGQRRPRLLRASVTEPSLFTSSTGSHALDMALPSSYRSSHISSGHTSPSGVESSNSSNNGVPGYSSYRRATDLLNHVAYLSSCATSPVASFSNGALFDRMSNGGGGSRRTSPHGSERRSSAAAVVGSRNGTTAVSSTGPGGSGMRSAGDSSVDACRRRANTDEVFGSSPASTHTSSSLDDLQHSPCSANYYSFPSFDIYDDNQDKEDDDVDN